MNEPETTTRRLTPTSALRWLTGFDGIPYLARPTFRYEQASLIAASLGMAVMVGGFPQFLAKKGLGATDWMLAALVAGMPTGCTVAALLTETLRRRRQPAVAAGCMFLAAALTAMVAMLPLDTASALAFVVLVTSAMAVIMTFIQARAAIWQANYPAGVRGNIISRNLILQTLLISLIVPSLGAILDWRPGAYRLIYLGGAASFVVSGLYIRRIRVRGETLRLRRQSKRRMELNPLAVMGVFGRNRPFATYMALQMILGSASLAVLPIIPKMLADTFDASYALSCLVFAAPLAAQVLSIPLLGGFFDRVSVFRFRFYGSSLWAVARLLLAAGVAMLAMPLVILSAFVMGTAQGFGRLAWSIGHMSFADPEETHLYMGAHLMLTGLRGLTMPFLGMWLYSSNVLGVHVIWISGVMQLMAAVGYWLTDPHRPTVAGGPSGPYTP